MTLGSESRYWLQVSTFLIFFCPTEFKCPSFSIRICERFIDIFSKVFLALRFAQKIDLRLQDAENSE